jgi:gamma-glutamyltranspeptidase
LDNNAPSQNATIVEQLLAQRKVTVFDHPPYSPDIAPADYFLPNNEISLEGASDIQKAVKNTLNTIAKNDFYKGIQKLYDHTKLRVELEGMYVET